MRTNMSVQTLVTKPDIPSTPTYLDWLRRLTVSKIFYSEKGDKDSEDDEKVGKIFGKYSLYNDWKLLENLHHLHLARLNYL
jgi:hypothetical protein